MHDPNPKYVKYTGEDEIDWAAKKQEYLDAGWKCDKDTDEVLWMSKYVDEDTEWMTDWNKRTGSFVTMNGRAKITLLKRRTRYEVD